MLEAMQGLGLLLLISSSFSLVEAGERGSDYSDYKEVIIF